MDRLRVPRDPGEITPRWLSQALDVGSEPSGPSVTGFSVENLAGGTGFINRLFRLGLRYDHDSPGLPSTVIAKFPSADPGLRRVFDRLEQNRREVRFYREMADGVHLETPRVYHGGLDSGTGNTVLLLEDMGSARQGDSVAGCSLDEARSCLEQLARFQASWWDSPLLDRLSWMPLKEAETGPYREIYVGAWQALQEKARGGMPPGRGSAWGCPWRSRTVPTGPGTGPTASSSTTPPFPATAPCWNGRGLKARVISPSWAAKQRWRTS